MASRFFRPFARVFRNPHVPRKNFIVPRALLLGLALLLCAAPALRANDTAKRPTLRNSPDLPVREIQHVLPHEVWEIIKDREYVAYVVLDGTVDRKGFVQVRKPLRAHPDKSWMKHVPQAMQGVQLTTIGVASRVPARVRTCVVFYPAPTGYTALVFVAQDDAVAHKATAQPYAGLAAIEVPAKDRQAK